MFGLDCRCRASGMAAGSRTRARLFVLERASTDDAANFVCRASFGKHLFDPDDSEEAGERE